MKYLNIVLYIVLLFSFTKAASSQNRLSGQVVDVVDGRTVVIDISTARMTVVLQLIEVPEPGQQLNKEIVDHLRDLLLGKAVEFKARSIVGSKTIGMVLLKDVDVSQQMLRDGAAWLEPAGTAGADLPERELYSASEAQAKADKLGVWSIKGLKPSWEYRAQKTEQEDRQFSPQAESYRFSSVGNPTPGRPRSQPPISSADQNMDAWADVMSGRSKESVGVMTQYNAGASVGMSYTSATFLDLKSGGERQRLETRALYLYHDRADGGKDKIYLIGFQVTAKEYRFARTNGMAIVADGARLSLGQAKRFWRQTSFGAQELLFYVVSRKTLTAIASARKSQVTIGSFTGPLDVDSQSLMLQLLDASQ